MKASRQQGRAGGALVLVCIAMVASGVLGSAMLSGLTAARYQRLNFDLGSRALYAAESGRAFVHAQRADDPVFVPAGTYTLGTGDQFILDAVDNGAQLAVTITGVTHGGTPREAHHAIAFPLAQPQDDTPLLPFFDFLRQRVGDAGGRGRADQRAGGGHHARWRQLYGQHAG